MVGEVERRIRAEQPRELRILRPTRDQRSPVAPEPSDLVLSGRRCDHDPTGSLPSVELDPGGQRAACDGVSLSAGDASLLERELEAVGSERQHDLLRLAEGVAQEDRRDPAVQSSPAPHRNRLDGRIGIPKAEMRTSVGALDDQHLSARDRSRRTRAGLAQLDVAGVEQANSLVLEEELSGPEHVSGRQQRD